LNENRENKLNQTSNGCTIYVSLGSNINPTVNIQEAIDQLKQFVDIIDHSSVWESPAVGSSGPNFLNAVVLICSPLPQEQLKDQILCLIEEMMGRVRTPDKNAPRPIDLDILIIDDQIVDQGIWSQPHLAIPLSELIPDLAHPGSGKSLMSISIKMLSSSEIYNRKDIQFQV
jgi:2-amino-4-hydroxy-6-hydroxymethyldihydropteridine diphosphokinase